MTAAHRPRQQEPAPDGPLGVPRYGTASLADLGPSVLASLGVPGEANVLGLAPARRACVLLVDGLGWEALLANRGHAPFLASLLEAAATPITSGFPSTTATSLATFGTGAAPGGHGVFGYQVALPHDGTVFNHLRWSADVDPVVWQPHRTTYQRAEAAGVATAYIAAGAYEGGGFTRASARGSRYVPADTATELVVGAEAALSAHERAYLFVYHSELDLFGHLYGVDSPHWRHHLGQVDRLAEQLASVLPADAVLYVTADHGMVDTGPHSRIDVEGDPDLAEGVRVLAGEPRARQVYTRPGAETDVLAAWRERLAGRATVVSRAEAVESGWFGPAHTVNRDLLPRVGDVLAVARGDTALVAPAVERVESRLVGHHGSLTPQELHVPLLRTGPAGGLG
ncbi:alkaline phosphatase family protein [Thermobifida halotolerans]|uniref:Alkaline phosphatase family protein n=1 Tax=Thermobifida halotolerans TaxID=483545 RepID=A0AA97LTL6_9ACTN|nr:nucleotide pyrophosphatase/phosphodiesterase family protein [Thermobifida halotolerans]UOE17824.1 alkaline phosphatase family protein [Thermobifida halotolerans]